ncbi:hypothetical protein BSKO_10626 [Bryopsis sp. KO-2023]|nr:hypothetical protein BSKO_10626 [Bryopsis sp. KO-2023]
MANALAGKFLDKEVEKGRVNPTKVKRYWPGRAPDWAQEEDEEAVLANQRRDQVAAPVVVSKADPRLKRLAVSDDVAGNEEVEHRRVRRKLEDDSGDLVVEAPVKDELEEHEEDEIVENEDEMLDRRMALRQRLLETRQNEEGLLPEEEEEEEDDDEDMESEWETDSDDEQLGRRLIKPVFVPKDERETIAEKERMEEEEEHEWETRKVQLDERKKETKEIVMEKIRQEDAALRNRVELPKAAAEIDTDDEKDVEKEFEIWKKRELTRIKREKDQLEFALKSAEEREMIKNMTEEELWERSASKPAINKGPKKKWKFLQKYWHKGAFFQGNPDDPRGSTSTPGIMLRDFSAPTGEDRVDKAILPKVMQVKNFGRSGRTKWTHLVNEDTTNFDHPWAINDAQRMKYNKKMAASEQKFTKPDKFKT